MIGVYVLLIVLLALFNVPISISIALSSVFYLVVEQIPLMVIPKQMFEIVDSFPFLAFPMFMLVGLLMNSGGTTRRIFDFAESLVGHMKGGLGHVNIVASVIFSGMSGSAIADAGGLGVIEIESMTERGYDKEFAVAITAASATIGPIIPPSVPVIIYAMAFGASIGELFLAGIIPGLLMAFALMIMVAIYSRKRDYPKAPFPPLKVILRNFRRSFLALLTPAILLGGMFSGVFTPTEAAAVAVVWSLLLGFVAYRELRWRDIAGMFIDVVVRIGVVLFLLATVGSLTWILSRENVPRQLLGFITAAEISPAMFLLIVNVVLLLMGMVTTITPSIILISPIFLPIVRQLAIDPTHFGIVVILNLMIGTLTPPVGPVLYVISTIGNISFQKAFKATIPFIIPLLVVLVIVTYWPDLVLLLPRLIMRQ